MPYFCTQTTSMSIKTKINFFTFSSFRVESPLITCKSQILHAVQGGANLFILSPICNTIIIQKQSFCYYQGMLLLVLYRFDICAQFLKRKAISSNIHNELKEFIFQTSSFKKRQEEYTLPFYGHAKQRSSYLFDKLNNLNIPTCKQEKWIPKSWNKLSYLCRLWGWHGIKFFDSTSMRDRNEQVPFMIHMPLNKRKEIIDVNGFINTNIKTRKQRKFITGMKFLTEM